MTQQEVAERSAGNLLRETVNKVENDVNKATTDQVRGGLAAAFGVDRDTLAAYLDGQVSLDDALARRDGAIRTIEYDRRYGELIPPALFRLAREFPDLPFERIKAAVDDAVAPKKNEAVDLETVLSRARVEIGRQKAGTKGKTIGRVVNDAEDEEIVIRRRRPGRVKKKNRSQEPP